jgi:hypothetical protein
MAGVDVSFLQVKINEGFGHRVVEIGAVELINHSLSGHVFHSYVNPERVMPADAIAVHGLTDAFLADKPLFAAVADEFLAFVGDAPLVAHNAGFDIAFLNAELKRAAKPPIVIERETLHGEEHGIIGSGDFAGRDELGMQRGVAVRARDAQPLLAQLCRSRWPDEKGYVPPGLSKPPSQIAARRTGSDNE